jgi:hypothetical protein
MKIGICINMNASGKDGIGLETLDLVKDAGFDYVEAPAAQLFALAPKALDEAVIKLKGCGPGLTHEILPVPSGESHPFPFCASLWIPAFAGMTFLVDDPFLAMPSRDSEGIARPARTAGGSWRRGRAFGVFAGTPKPPAPLVIPANAGIRWA